MGRAPCCEKVGLKRGRWTAEEDEKLARYIKDNGEGAWRSLPKNAGLLRCGKSCRLRWINYLREDLKRGNISPQEEETIIKLHASLGNRWSVIAGHLPGRTDNEIKNYWNSHLSRRIHTFRRRNDVINPSPVIVDVATIGSRRRKSNKKREKKNQKNQTQVTTTNTIISRVNDNAEKGENSKEENPSVITDVEWDGLMRLIDDDGSPGLLVGPQSSSSVGSTTTTSTSSTEEVGSSAVMEEMMKTWLTWEEEMEVVVPPELMMGGGCDDDEGWMMMFGGGGGFGEEMESGIDSWMMGLL